MKFFKRAEEIKETTEETTEDAILEAFLDEENVTFDIAMKIPAFSACINLITNTIAMIPIKLYKKGAGEVEEVTDDNRVKLLNTDTKDTLEGTQFKKAIIRDYFQKGGYAYINRNGLHIESLHYVKNNEVSFQQSTDPIFKSYTIMVRGDTYEPFQFLKVLRNTENGMHGKSIVEENRDIIATAYNALMYEKDIAKTGGNKKGVIEAERELTREAITALKRAWRKLYKNNSENIVILNKGLKFQETSNSATEIQMHENKKANGDEICKIFNMPPEMLKGGAQENDKIRFIQYCILPILNELENAANRDLLLESEKDSYFFAADTTELTKGDIKTRYEAYEIAYRNGFVQLDEIRTKEHLVPLGLDFIKFGLQDVMYNTKTKEFYVPNMNGNGNFGNTEQQKEQQEGEENEDRVKE